MRLAHALGGVIRARELPSLYPGECYYAKVVLLSGVDVADSPNALTAVTVYTYAVNGVRPVSVYAAVNGFAINTPPR